MAFFCDMKGENEKKAWQLKYVVLQSFLSLSTDSRKWANIIDIETTLKHCVMLGPLPYDWLLTIWEGFKWVKERNLLNIGNWKIEWMLAYLFRFDDELIGNIKSFC